MNKIEKIEKLIRNVPDFPKEGILFKDITPLLNSPVEYNMVIDEFYNQFKDKGVTKVCGIESRGFIMGGALASKMNAGFVPIRKPGKLPYSKHSIEYELEYGTDCLEIHTDALAPDDIVLIHDDLLATGGTIKAAADLVKKFDVRQVFLCCTIELLFLNGRQKLEDDIFTLLRYE